MADLAVLNVTVSVYGGTVFASDLCKDFIHKIKELQEAQPATADNLRHNRT